MFYVCFQSLLSDLSRFKIEDVPPRLEMRKRALRLFDDIQVGIYPFCLCGCGFNAAFNILLVTSLPLVHLTNFQYILVF